MAIRPVHLVFPLLAGAVALGIGASAVQMLGLAPAAAEPVLCVAACSGLIAALAATALGWARARRTEAELRRSQARERSIVDGAGEAIIVIDDQAQIHTFNRAAEAMFGYAPEEIVGTSLERLMTDGVRQAHAAYLAAHGITAMVEAGRVRAVHKGLRKTGQVFPFELTMTEWRDGEQRMFTGVMRDVSERERAKAALKESRARYAGLYENSPEVLSVYVLDDAGGFRLESINRATEDYTGLSRSVLVGATPEHLAEPAEARGFKRALLRCIDTHATVTHDLRVEIRGEPCTLRLTLSPMREASGEVTRVLASGREVPADAPAAA